MQKNGFIRSPLVNTLILNGGDLRAPWLNLVLVLDVFESLTRDAHVVSLRLVCLFVEFGLLGFSFFLTGLDHGLIAVGTLNAIFCWVQLIEVLVLRRFSLHLSNCLLQFRLDPLP